jgi:hypothetical protein
VEQLSKIEVNVTWGDEEPPGPGSDDNDWSRTPKRVARTPWIWCSAFRI